MRVETSVSARPSASVLSRVRKALRYVGICLMLIAAMLAAAIVTSLTVDVGPAVRKTVESYGSAYIERPIHIGRLSIHVLSGRFVIEDLSIEGLRPGDRPFFTAKHLSLALDWGPAMQKTPEVRITSVEMTDWRMLVERWDNAHNFPKIRRNDEPDGPRRVTTTLQYFHAWRGQFAYEDHAAPWSIVCPNLDLNIGNLPNYHGEAVFTGGTVKIQNFEPMSARMRARFVLDGPHVRLDRIDLDTDGAKTVASGDVDFAHWPEQTYDFQSAVDFPRMRQIFFADQKWDLTGSGGVAGTFHLFQGGRDLTATFASDIFGWNGYQFPMLRGSLEWTPKFFEIRNASSKVYGGGAQFSFDIKPLGDEVPAIARFETTYVNADIAPFTDFQGWRGLRFAGAASGRHVLEWPIGHFADSRHQGSMTLTPPAGVHVLTAPNAAASTVGRVKHEPGPLGPVPLALHEPVAAEVTYRFDRNQLVVDPSRFGTQSTFVAFEGATAWGERSRFAFHVTSQDWQESDLVLAGLLADFGSSSDPVVTVEGRGEFDGVMTGPFRSARVEGTFRGDELRAWDTLWGTGSGHIVFENSYITLNDGLVRLNDSEIRTDGIFSLEIPRRDGGEEINARFIVSGRDVEGLRHAFQLDDYPVSGNLSGEFHLTGQRRRPGGFGNMTIERGVAYGQAISKASASLRFDGSGIRLDGIEMAKADGAITGAAYVGIDLTYAFNFDGRRISVDRIEAFTYPRAPISGVAEFAATGNGTFDLPRYDVKFRVSDLVVAEEPVGLVTGELTRRGEELSGQVDAASPRLTITAAGRIGLAPGVPSELAFRFHDSALDPWLRLVASKLPTFTTAVASGSVRVSGDIRDVDRLLVDGTVDTVDICMRTAAVRDADPDCDQRGDGVFDYPVTNKGPIRLTLEHGRVDVHELELIGQGTRLRVSGTVGVQQDEMALKVGGEADLQVLQGFFGDLVRGSGRAEVTAAINGRLQQPVFAGTATITDGRVRHLSWPNSFEAINGVIAFDERGARLDGVTATLGGGRVEFGGRIGFDGYLPNDLNITLHGEDMQLRTRLVEGLQSTLGADVAVTGTLQSPMVGGTVTVKTATLRRRFDEPDIFDIIRRASSGGGAAGGVVGAGPSEAESTFPLRWDLRIVVPSTLRVESNLLRLVANADLSLQGTYDRPVLSGHAEVETGVLNLENRRYKLNRGAIDFNNPNRIDPFFDFELETNVRVPGPPVQTYRIVAGFAGTTDKFQLSVSSDPPLPTADAVALLFSDARRNTDVEFRARQSPNQAETDILTAGATQVLTGTISSEVAKVVEQTFGVDTFQLTPSFVDPFGQQTSRLNPTARLTIGKRVSDRVYLTFSRSLGTTINDQIVLLEFEQTDRFSWILSRNEDQQTYAIEFRVRHSF